MAFTKIQSTQTAFLHNYLRGTNRSLTEAQARSLFNIKNLRARMSELRQMGLRVRTEQTQDGRTRYSVSRRDVAGYEYSLVSK
jgi:hypothetical protein